MGAPEWREKGLVLATIGVLNSASVGGFVKNSFQLHATSACRLLYLAVACAFLNSSVSAQTFFGSIVGTVTDQSGASVAVARVTLTNTGTDERRTDQTDNLGNYQFVNLVPGLYKVDIEATGFKHLTRDQVQVEVQSAVRIDAPMQAWGCGASCRGDRPGNVAANGNFVVGA